MRIFNRKVGILTAFLHFFIVIGAGHGIAFLGLLEFFIFNADKAEIHFNLTSSYDDSLFAAAFFGLLGQAGLISTVISKKYNYCLIFILLLWLSFYYLAHNFFESSVSRLSVYTGIPFMVVSIFFLVGIRISKMTNNKSTP